MTATRRLKNDLKDLGRDTRGASAVEYVMILAAVAATVVVAWTTLGTNLNAMFTSAATGVSSTGSASGSGSAVEVADAGESDDSASDDDSESDSDADSDSN